MKPEIENLKVWMSGRSTTGYQRALGMREFEKLLDYIAELEQLRQPPVSGSLGFDEGYEKGWTDATSQAINEIQKNYKPNDR